MENPYLPSVEFGENEKPYRLKVIDLCWGAIFTCFILSYPALFTIFDQGVLELILELTGAGHELSSEDKARALEFMVTVSGIGVVTVNLFAVVLVLVNYHKHLLFGLKVCVGYLSLTLVLGAMIAGVTLSVEWTPVVSILLSLIVGLVGYSLSCFD